MAAINLFQVDLDYLWQFYEKAPPLPLPVLKGEVGQCFLHIPTLPRFLLGRPFGPPSFFLNFPFKFVWLTYVGLPNAFCKNILSTALDLSSVAIRKRHRKNPETISIVKPQLIIFPYLRWFVTFRCVCDVTIAPRIASTTENKNRWRSCPGKIPYMSHYNLRNSALVLFEVTANSLFSQYRLQTLIFKYRPGRWNTGHLTTLDICSR